MATKDSIRYLDPARQALSYFGRKIAATPLTTASVFRPNPTPSDERMFSGDLSWVGKGYLVGYPTEKYDIYQRSTTSKLINDRKCEYYAKKDTLSPMTCIKGVTFNNTDGMYTFESIEEYIPLNRNGGRSKRTAKRSSRNKRTSKRRNKSRTRRYRK